MKALYSIVNCSTQHSLNNQTQSNSLAFNIVIAGSLFELAFFVFTIIGAYYFNHIALQIVAICFAVFGLILFICVILFNADFRIIRGWKRKVTFNSISSVKEKIKHIIEVENSKLRSKSLKWKLTEDCRFLELNTGY